MNTELQVAVTGMTCDHCVRSVSEAVRSTPGASSADVSVDLDTGLVTIRGAELDRDAVVDAIADAGYDVAS